MCCLKLCGQRGARLLRGCRGSGLRLLGGGRSSGQCLLGGGRCGCPCLLCCRGCGSRRLALGLQSARGLGCSSGGCLQRCLELQTQDRGQIHLVGTGWGSRRTRGGGCLRINTHDAMHSATTGCTHLLRLALQPLPLRRQLLGQLRALGLSLWGSR